MRYEMSLGVVQQQVQRLVMTPELRQAIQLLQLPTMELGGYIQEQLLQNPLLEAEADAPAGAGAEAVHGGDEAVHDGPGVGQTVAAEPAAREAQLDWAQYFGEAGDGSWEGRPPDRQDDDPIASIRWEPGMVEALRFELRASVDSPRAQRIGDYLLGCIDDRGYLAVAVEEVARALGVDTGEVLDVLHVIHNLDPVGIGARSLEECLSLQIAALPLAEEERRLALAVVAGHLEDVAAGRLHRVCASTGAGMPQVRAALDIIRSLSPWPGSGALGRNEISYVTADVFVERVDGEYLVIPNDSALPKLMINNRYRALLTDPAADAAARDFVREKLNSALWLVRALAQRRNTITRVAECIVRRQLGFLEHGIMQLQPMTLKDVAAEIGVHESTVSRATSGKYAQTPRGLFELKFFFGSGVTTHGGQLAAAESVRTLIRRMIEAEDPSQPLPDQSIKERLSEVGVRISRRTVAKYREELMIPASAARRRY